MYKITYNKKDLYIEEILKKSNLINFKTESPFYVYGLKNYPDDDVIKKQHCVIFGSNPHKEFSIHANRFGLVYNFLMHQGIRTDWGFPLDGYNRMTIGLRLDLREHIELSGAILKTIIFTVEGNIMNFNKEIKLKLPPEILI